MKTLVSTILLDLGRVVFDLNFDLTWQTWARESGVNAQELKARFDNDLGKSDNDQHYQSYERGAISSREYLRHFNRRVGVTLDFDQFLLGWNAMFTEPVDGMRELMRDIKRTDIALYAFSNTNVDHELVWRERYADSLQYFDQIYTSSGIGHRKPGVESFRVVIEHINRSAETARSAEDILFFDDLNENVAGARDAGLQAAVFEDAATARNRIESAIGRALA